MAIGEYAGYFGEGIGLGIKMKWGSFGSVSIIVNTHFIAVDATFPKAGRFPHSFYLKQRKYRIME